MRKYSVVFFIFSGLFCCISASAQIDELKQLKLDTEKLLQLKAMLDNMIKGYSVLSNGYSTISNLSKDNFDLHKNYIDGLSVVSPSVRSDKRIAAIMNAQAVILTEYHKAMNQVRQSVSFSSNEKEWIGKQFDAILDRSGQAIEQLELLLNASTFRMNDAQRLAGISDIDKTMKENLGALQNMIAKANTWVEQRNQLIKENKTLRSLYGL